MIAFAKLALTGVLCLGHLVGDGPDPLKVKPVKTIAGGDSKVDYPLVRLISSQKGWHELWAIHTGQPMVPESGENTKEDPVKPPEVDFVKNQVLVVFGGHLPNVKA